MHPQDPFELLAGDIKIKSKGRKIIYLPNAGNYGDGLIRYATKAFFNDYKIDHIEVSTQTLAKLVIPALRFRHSSPYFIYGGGGSWHSGYSFGYHTVKYISFFSKNIMVLPSTYGFKLNMPNVSLYRRDNSASYKNAESSIFCPDMAVYLEVQNKRDYKKKEFQYEHCYAFRGDIESALPQEKIPKENVDFSILGDHMSNGDDFIRLVGRYKKITTDRLHVAIAASLCGCEVDLYSGNYPKIRDAYNDSLSQYFPKINLKNDINDV